MRSNLISSLVVVKWISIKQECRAPELKGALAITRVRRRAQLRLAIGFNAPRNFLWRGRELN